MDGIEGSRGLVDEEHPRRAEERDREVEPLAIADREVAARPAAVGQLEIGEQARRRRPRVRLALEPREELEVLARGQSSVVRRPLRRPADAQILESLDLSLRRIESTGQHGQEGRLAGAVRAHERDRLARRDGEVGGRQRQFAAEPPRDSARQ